MREGKLSAPLLCCIIPLSSTMKGAARGAVGSAVRRVRTLVNLCGRWSPPIHLMTPSLPVALLHRWPTMHRTWRERDLHTTGVLDASCQAKALFQQGAQLMASGCKDYDEDRRFLTHVAIETSLLRQSSLSDAERRKRKAALDKEWLIRNPQFNQGLVDDVPVIVALEERAMFKEATRLLQQAAEDGVVEAHELLGKVFADGRCHIRDPARALYHLEEAMALRNDPDVMFHAGRILVTGGVEKKAPVPIDLDEPAMNSPEFANWFLRPENREKIAPEGLEYLEKTTKTQVTVNITKGMQFLAAAAEEGHIRAMHTLADLFLNGEGIARDAKKGLPFLERAASEGDASALFRLGSLFWDGVNGPDDEVILPLDVERGMQLIKQSADQGYPPGLYFLGHAYHRGIVVPQDVKKAIRALKAASNMGLSESAVYLFNMFLSGDGVDVDQQRGMECLYLAGGMNNPDALLTLGNLHFRGSDGVSVDHAQAIEYWRQGALARSGDAACCLAAAYYYGLGGLEKDSNTSFDLYQQAAVFNHREAWKNLAIMHHYGDGVKKNDRMSEAFRKLYNDNLSEGEEPLPRTEDLPPLDRS